ncbi:MAG: hypothetical protein ACKV0T_11350 [Planctomycetales bacterium]
MMLLKVTYLRFPAIADLLVEVERRQLPLAVQAKVAVIDHFCELTAVQKRKLHLAGQGDIKRFYDRLNVLRLRFEVSAEDWDGELHHPLVAPLAFDQEKDILSNALANGLFNEGSLFAKVLESTLNAEQAAGIAASRPVRQE